MPHVPLKVLNLLNFLSGTHSYIDGTKDWKTIRKRLRFQMPHVPLKVLRGEQDQVDIQDQYFDSFVAPGTTTEDAEDDNDTDDDSRTSDDDVATDIGEPSEMGMNKYLGDHPSSTDSMNQFNNYVPESQDDHQAHFNNYPKYNTTGSFEPAVVQVQIGVRVHHIPDSDDGRTPLLANMHGDRDF